MTTDNADTGAITGSDSNITYNASALGDSLEAICNLLNGKPGVTFVTEDEQVTSIVIGTGVEKTADSVVPEDLNKTFSFDDLQTDSEGYLYFDVNGLRVRIIGERTENNIAAVTKANFENLQDYQKFIIAGFYKWWVEESLKLNEASYNLGFTSDGEAYKLELIINENYYNTLTNENNYNGKVNDASYLDRNLAHEFIHAIMAANINYVNKLPTFIKEGMAELTHGIDDEYGNIISKIAYDSNWLDKSLNMEKLANSPQEVGNDYAGGFMFMRYFAHQAA